MAAVSASTKAEKLWGRQGDAVGQAGWRPGGSPAPLGGRRGLHIPVAMLGICVIVLQSVIHQKVLWERSRVSGFLIYQLAIPGL